MEMRELVARNVSAALREALNASRVAELDYRLEDSGIPMSNEIRVHIDEAVRNLREAQSKLCT